MTTACATWCGTDDWPEGGTVWFPDDVTANHGFCSAACYDAGKPLHSASKPPGEPPHECPSCDLDDSVKVPAGKLLASTPIKRPPGEPVPDERWQRFNDTTGALSWNRRSAAEHPDRCVCQNETTPHKHYDYAPHACARCGDCNSYRPAVEPAPGGALPLPGPPATATATAEDFAAIILAGLQDKPSSEGNYDASLEWTANMVAEAQDTLRRDLAEARTALAHAEQLAKLANDQCEYMSKDRASILARLAVTVGALEVAGAEFFHLAETSTCVCDEDGYDGMVCECAGDGRDSDGMATMDGCAHCAAFHHERAISAALAPTGAPSAKEM